MLNTRAQFMRGRQLSLAGPDALPHAAILLVNLDRCEVIKHNLGGLAARQALAVIGRRLQAVLRPTDLLARLRDDEFAILGGTPNRQADAVLKERHPIHQVSRRR